MNKKYDITFRVEVDAHADRIYEVEEYLMRCIPSHTDIRSYGKGTLIVQYISGHDKIEEVK